MSLLFQFRSAKVIGKATTTKKTRIPSLQSFSLQCAQLATRKYIVYMCPGVLFSQETISAQHPTGWRYSHLNCSISQKFPLTLCRGHRGEEPTYLPLNKWQWNLRGILFESSCRVLELRSFLAAIVGRKYFTWRMRLPDLWVMFGPMRRLLASKGEKVVKSKHFRVKLLLLDKFSCGQFGFSGSQSSYKSVNQTTYSENHLTSWSVTFFIWLAKSQCARSVRSF